MVRFERTDNAYDIWLDEKNPHVLVRVGLQFLELDGLYYIWFQPLVIAVDGGLCRDAFAYEVVPQTDILWRQVTEVADKTKLPEAR